jgi:hypothetical protein
MKNVKSFTSLKTTEIVALVFFILYLVFPVQTPSYAASYVESPLGIALIVTITVALFLYSNPLLAVLFVFVGYTLLRRSSGGDSILAKLSSSVSDLSNVSDVYDTEDVSKPILKKRKKVTKKPFAAEDASYPMDYVQSVDNIERVVLVERDLAEGTYTREEQSIMNDQTVVTQPVRSLEEDMVKKMAPIDKPTMPIYTPTGFQPVASNVGYAATY